jgi:actin, other eukaryote
MFEGFHDRILREIENRAPRNINVRVIANPDRKLNVWKGGSTLSSLSTFSNLCITKEDYDEYGA